MDERPLPASPIDPNERPPVLEYGKPARSARPQQVVRASTRLLWVACWVTVALLVLAGIGSMIPDRGRRGSPQLKCASQLRSIAQHMLLYVQSNGGQLPPDLAALEQDHRGIAHLLVCPESAATPATGTTTAEVVHRLRTHAGHCSYMYLGAGLTSATVTPRHIIALDHAGNHAGKVTNVLYGDWSVNRLDRKEAAHVRSELAAGHNPPRPQPPQTAPQ
jgi:hypothetical protein